MSNVTFEPRCRNNWHYHKGGRFVAPAGIGYYQEKGETGQKIVSGDNWKLRLTIHHWYGAVSDSWFCPRCRKLQSLKTNEAVWLSPVERRNIKKRQAKRECMPKRKPGIEARNKPLSLSAAYTGKETWRIWRQGACEGT